MVHYELPKTWVRHIKNAQEHSKEDDYPPVHRVPATQSALLLHRAKSPYELCSDHPVSQTLHPDEALIKSKAIGLNPIDWKGPDYNFGIPELPCVSGRELAGEVVLGDTGASQWKVGERVIAISTDYRDQRKSAFQEYVVAHKHNVVRLPPTLSFQEGSTIGVAFVTASLALGISMGLDFSNVLGGPNLLKLVRSVSIQSEDLQIECLQGITEDERLRPNGWVVLWGGSATSVNIIIQLARLAGLRVIVAVDVAKHGFRISNHKSIRPDLLVDSHDPERAIRIIKDNTNDGVRFAMDVRGRETSECLLRVLSKNISTTDGVDGTITPPVTPKASDAQRSHLVGLVSLPKTPAPENVLYHSVPIKLFHEVPEIGCIITDWLGRLLSEGRLALPDIIDVEYGFEQVNAALNRMRNGEISGGKLVVEV